MLYSRHWIRKKKKKKKNEATQLLAYGRQICNAVSEKIISGNKILLQIKNSSTDVKVKQSRAVEWSLMSLSFDLKLAQTTHKLIN
jgi:hypothetical protein